jgi:sugar transferase EpsL
MTAPRRSAKRVIDLLGAGAGLIALAPVLLLIALAVRHALGSPVLFRQVRPGRHGQPFELLKFRTMTEARDAAGQPLPDAQRLTRLGSWLRSTSLDELPELINVLRGDMSLVGPRPLLPEYLPHYSAEQGRRHEARPGITGWAAVQGRNALSWERRLALDVWYVDNWSLLLDLKILLMTVVKVLKREGISAEGHATMPRFDDNAARGATPEGAGGGAQRGSAPPLPSAGWRVKRVHDRKEGAR